VLAEHAAKNFVSRLMLLRYSPAIPLKNLLRNFGFFDLRLTGVAHGALLFGFCYFLD